ncbi:unnamed protein product [Musa hybrid cultivar]
MEVSTAMWTAVVVGAAAVYWFVWVMGAAEVKGKRAVNLTMGSITRDKVQDKYKQYWSFFRRPKEDIVAASDNDDVPAFVDTFYNLVTDIYEWGWGQSFHFSPSIPGRSHRDATRLHEERAADLIAARPGRRILDVGCGVGGPMRAIAAHSGAHVVGITINEYQVARARAHNRKAGLHDRCEVVCGNFLEMPFDDASFDGAYSIEATCHAPRLEDVYREVFRVLKPGALYVSYEWVTTALYRADNPAHVETIRGIERGDALPGLRAHHEIAEVARQVGFEVVEERDQALPPAEPWWTRLKMGRIAYWRNHLVVSALAALRIAPKGVVDVHEMLCETARHLSDGGETGIFTPMHIILCRKPLELLHNFYYIYIYIYIYISLSLSLSLFRSRSGLLPIFLVCYMGPTCHLTNHNCGMPGIAYSSGRKLKPFRLLPVPSSQRRRPTYLLRFLPREANETKASKPHNPNLLLSPDAQIRFPSEIDHGHRLPVEELIPSLPNRSLSMCAGCGADLNLSAAHLYPADAYFEAGNKGTLSFSWIDDARFRFAKEDRIMPFFETVNYWGIQRRRTRILCDACGRLLGHIYDDGPPMMRGHGQFGFGPSQAIPRAPRYRFKIKALNVS